MTTDETVWNTLSPKKAERFLERLEFFRANPGAMADIMARELGVTLKTTDRNSLIDKVCDALNDDFVEREDAAKSILREEEDDDNPPYDARAEHGTYRVIMGRAS